MYSRFQLTIKYLDYLLSSSNGKGHGIHSPFVFDFIKNILNDKSGYPEYKIVEELRNKLVKDKTVIEVKDLGAGSLVSKSTKRSISSIARHAVKPRKYAQLLFRIARYYQSQAIIELGTSLGITSTYLSLAGQQSELSTLEGVPAIADIANKNFDNLGLKNIKLIRGNFDDTLIRTLEKFSTLDLAYIDGNHRQEPTERYFSYLLPKIHNNSIVIFDDIHWSRAMDEAWKNIKDHSAVRCSIDLFFIGIIFFRSEFKEKQHFTIRF